MQKVFMNVVNIQYYFTTVKSVTIFFQNDINLGESLLLIIGDTEIISNFNTNVSNFVMPIRHIFGKYQNDSYTYENFPTFDLPA